MPDRLAEDLLMFIRQNKGQLPNRRRTKEFAKLTDKEVGMLEAIVREAFEGFEDAGARRDDVQGDPEETAQRSLEFPRPEEWYDFDRRLVAFWGLDGKTRVRCEISGDTLDDHFHGDNIDKLEVFRANRQTIEQHARRKYLAGETEPDGSVLIRTADL